MTDDVGLPTSDDGLYDALSTAQDVLLIEDSSITGRRVRNGAHKTTVDRPSSRRRAYAAGDRAPQPRFEVIPRPSIEQSILDMQVGNEIHDM